MSAHERGTGLWELAASWNQNKNHNLALTFILILQLVIILLLRKIRGYTIELTQYNHEYRLDKFSLAYLQGYLVVQKIPRV